MRVAIIPARAGSKRIPGKNVRPFCGKPIISYSIKAAIETGLFDKIIVSTDSQEIAKIAQSFGAEIPFMRPAQLADDFAGTAPVLVHALNCFKYNGFFPEFFCCIYATAPFINPNDIIRGFELLRQSNSTIAFSVTTFAYPVFRALTVAENGRVRMIWPEYHDSRSQDLPESYHDAGQFYWGVVEKFLEERDLFSKDAVPVVLDRHLVQDIDTPEDWKTAEKMYISLQM